MGDLAIGFEVTGYFLKNWMVPQMNKKTLPESRGRLMDTLKWLF